ncbi:MAG: M14 family metallopeptidase [Anaerolineales bacterium]|nr:M14 family metallopeptidase [Anaerolineales bacterium]
MRKGLSGFVILLWSVVILTLIGIVFYLLPSSDGSIGLFGSAPSSTATETILPSMTPSPLPHTITPLPTITSTATNIPPSLTPTLPQPQIIGTSAAGRPLEVFQFGNGPTQKMIVAGIHGGYEWNTIVLADELIDYLKSHPEIIPSDQTLYFFRAFNPDGFERSRGFGGRANENNVDLNRNFPSNWQAEWPRIGCWDYIPITAGSAPASEPETQALISFIESHELKAFISFHSAALGIFPGGQPPDAGSLSLAESLAAVSDYPYPPIEAGCAYTGQLVDWVSDQGIPGVDIELTDHQDSDFEINLGVLSVFLDWSFPE